MTVKEVLKTAATELGILEEVADTLEGTSTAENGAVENMLNCFNLVENELALDYLPLIVEEELETETGAVLYSELSRSAVQILKVTDVWGNETQFKLFPDHLKTQAGRIKIRYSYTPEKKNLEDSSDFLLHASVRMLAYGVAAEYSLACGRFEDAAVWDKKYKDSIAAAYRRKPTRKIQSRRWV